MSLNPTHSLAVSTGSNNLLAICFLTKTSGPPSVSLEGRVQTGMRHFDLTVVIQHELWRVVQILRHCHKVSIGGHQFVAGTVITVDRRPRSNAEKLGPQRRQRRAWAPPSRQSRATRSNLLLMTLEPRDRVQRCQRFIGDRSLRTT